MLGDKLVARIAVSLSLVISNHLKTVIGRQMDEDSVLKVRLFQVKKWRVRAKNCSKNNCTSAIFLQFFFCPVVTLAKGHSWSKHFVGCPTVNNVEERVHV